MNDVFPSCCICSAEADWVRTRMHNDHQMEALCHHHHSTLRQRNPVLASYYDVIGSLPQRQVHPAKAKQNSAGVHATDDYSRGDRRG